MTTEAERRAQAQRQFNRAHSLARIHAPQYGDPVEIFVMRFGAGEKMKFLYLFVTAFCTFSVLLNFGGSMSDALNGALAVFNFGLFLRA